MSLDGTDLFQRVGRQRRRLEFDSVNGLGSEHLSDGRNRICIGTACTVRSDIPVIPVIMYMYQLLKAEVAAEIPFATAE